MEIDKPLVSIIMSVYNEPKEYITKAIDSIINQTYSNIQLILILDNPLNIDAKTVIFEYIKKDPRIIFSENEVNRGITFSLNKALSLASGLYIARMDADDISFFNRIEDELSYLKQNHLDLVGCNIINYLDDVPSEKATVFPENHSGLIKYLRYDSCIPHPSWLARKEVYETLKGYRDIDACEDYDFLVRAVLYGFRIGVLQEPLLYYRINDVGVSNKKKSLQKATLSLIRKKYKEKQVLSIDEYKQMINGEIGRELIHQYAMYYEKTKALKKSSSFDFLVKGILLFFKSSIARNIIKNILIERVLIFLY